MKKIGIIGSGIVAQVLGAGLLKHGYDVKLGTRDALKLNDWLTNHGKGAEVGTFSEAAKFGDLLILAVKGKVASSALQLIDQAYLDGKTIMDATNPIEEGAPQNGVLQFFTNQNESLMEQLQVAFSTANFVKAFNSVGSARMVNPPFDIKPSMFICGNNNASKEAVGKIAEALGWEVEDMGGAEAARAIEPLCMLWCIPGFLNNQWTHAFKLLK